MLRKINILTPLSRSKKLMLSILFTGLAALSFASMAGGDGGGNKLRSTTTPSGMNGFTPLKLTSDFTLKTGRNYRANSLFNEAKKPATYNYIQLNSLITYQRGNVTYVLPYSNKVSVSTGKSNIQAIGLKMNIHH